MSAKHRVGLLLVVIAGACSGNGPETDPDAPVIASFTSSVEPLFENGTVMFLATVTDPQGPSDILSGTLKSQSSASYGTFQARSPGEYVLAVDWATIQGVMSITGDANGEAREFIAEFVDMAGHKSTEPLTLTLACRATGIEEAPCDGTCTPIDSDRFNCGGCNLACPGAADHPADSGLSFCRNALCQEVRLTFNERISCEAACASRGGKCDHDNQCPGQACDPYEQSFAMYGDDGLDYPLAGCNAVPAATNANGQPFVSLGCNCKDLPAT